VAFRRSPLSARTHLVSDAQFSVEQNSVGPVVTASGQLDLAVKDDLRDVLSPLAGIVTVDLGAVTFVDSSAIGVFVGVHKRLTSDGGALRLRNPQDMPRRALEIVGLRDWIVD
jgi:anti-sigma B factor antagonist